MPQQLFHDKQLTLMRMEQKLVSALHEHPGAVDDTAEPAGHHVQERADPRQQEDGANRKLDGLGDRADGRGGNHRGAASVRQVE